MCITYKKFCGCCCNVIQSSKIIAILELISGVIYFIYYLFNMPKESDYDFHDRGIYLAAAPVTIVSVILGITTSALMLYGIEKRRPGFLLPWLVGSMMSLVMGTVITVMIYGKVVRYYIFYKEYIGVVTISAIICGLIFAFFFYIWDIVKSAYKQIKEENRLNQLALPNHMPVKINLEQTPPEYKQVVYTVQAV